MKNIKLSLLKHREEEHIKIEFMYDFNTKEYIKKFPNVRWSNTKKTFYLPFSKENTNSFYLYLKENKYNVNYNDLVDTITIKEDAIKPSTLIAINKFNDWLLSMRYSKNTIKTYLSMITLFFRFYKNIDIANVTKTDIENFNTNYIMKNSFSYTYQNQLINALKLFYKYTNNENLDLEHLDRPKKSRKLPEVLSIEEIKSILSSTKNVKHLTLLSLLYSCGLRIGEAIDLKIASIDFTRRLLHIKSGKGRKDRYIPISPTMITLLNKYIARYKPTQYLFKGQFKPQYSAVSARQVLRRLTEICGIKKSITLHTLRHSYATHLLENGTDIRFIQELLGHNSPKTTMIYTHVSTTSLQKIKNPFDDFNI